MSSIPFSLGAVIEYYVFVYMFKFSELQKESMKYAGEKAPKWIENLLEGKVVIAILLGNLGLACLNQVTIR